MQAACSSRCHSAAPRWAARSNRRTPRVTRSREYIRTRAENNGGAELIYPGVYGAWKLTQEDITEVFIYRVGLGISATGFATAAATYLLSGDVSAPGSLQAAQDVGVALGAAGLGVSLVLIHMYAAVIKRTMQAFWATGFAGGLFLMATQDPSLPQYVAEHREAVWLVGPLFAAITGLGIKEGLCYGKPEAALLAALTPLLLLGHLTGLLEGAPENVLMVACLGSYCLLAARKWTQAVKDDVGDKSIFEFQKMSEEEQRALLRSLGRFE